ncbi:Methyltransferase domain-containing protein [Cladophialophora immunda]|nr:Methyltransferase domain-containing protein [Cladophialophora immunda]
MDPAQFDKMFSQADRIMGPFAEVLLRQANFPPVGDSRLVVLDQACGSGVVSSHIMSRLSTEGKSRLDLTCADISDAMISNVSRRIETSGWDNVSAVKADAMDTKFPSSHFTHIFFNFGPQILSNPLDGIRECHRILRSGGVLSCSTWQDVPWWADYRAGIAKHPSLPPFPSDEQLGHAFSDTTERWNSVEDVKAHMQECGFRDAEVQVVENTTKMDVAEVEAMLPYSLDMMVQKFWKDKFEQFKEPARRAILDHMKDKYGSGPVVWKWVGIVAGGRKG